MACCPWTGVSTSLMKPMRGKPQARLRIFPMDTVKATANARVSGVAALWISVTVGPKNAYAQMLNRNIDTNATERCALMTVVRRVGTASASTIINTFDSTSLTRARRRSHTVPAPNVPIAPPRPTAIAAKAPISAVLTPCTRIKNGGSQTPEAYTMNAEQTFPLTNHV
jgi:hypothetical protein